MEYNDMIFGVVVALLIMYIVYNLSKYVYNWYSRTYNKEGMFAATKEFKEIIDKNRALTNSVNEMDRQINITLNDITEFQILSLQLAIDSDNYYKGGLEYFKSSMKDSKENVESSLIRMKDAPINEVFHYHINKGTAYLDRDYNYLELHYELNRFLTHLINRENSTELYSGSVRIRDEIRKQYWEYMNK